MKNIKIILLVLAVMAPLAATGANVYTKTGPGGWGGSCTCPDGQIYQVGDNGDSCGSLSCVGGVPGTCNHYVDNKWKNGAVTCATPRKDDFESKIKGVFDLQKLRAQVEVNTKSSQDSELAATFSLTASFGTSRVVKTRELSVKLKSKPDPKSMLVALTTNVFKEILPEKFVKQVEDLMKPFKPALDTIEKTKNSVVIKAVETSFETIKKLFE